MSRNNDQFVYWILDMTLISEHPTIIKLGYATDETRLLSYRTENPREEVISVWRGCNEFEEQLLNTYLRMLGYEVKAGKEWFGDNTVIRDFLRRGPEVGLNIVDEFMWSHLIELKSLIKSTREDYIDWENYFKKLERSFS